MKKILCIPDKKNSVYSLSHILKLDTLPYHKIDEFKKMWLEGGSNNKIYERLQTS
jgi:hypothetical protein